MYTETHMMTTKGTDVTRVRHKTHMGFKPVTIYENTCLDSPNNPPT